MAIKEVGKIPCECASDPEFTGQCNCVDGAAAFFTCCNCSEEFEIADETPYWSGTAYACRECAQATDDAQHEDLCVAALEASRALHEIAMRGGLDRRAFKTLKASEEAIKALSQISANLDGCVIRSRGEEV